MDLELTKLSNFVAHWFFYWRSVVRRPAYFFWDPNTALSVPARKFLAVTLLSALLLPSAYVIIPTLLASLSSGAFLALAIAGVAFPLAAVGQVLLASVFASAIALTSYLAYRALGSDAPFRVHFRQFFFLGALEPIVVFFALIYLQAPAPSFEGSWPLGVLLAARVWALYAGFCALRSVHSLSRSRGRIAYLIGFLLPGLVATTLNIAIWYGIGFSLYSSFA